MTSEEFLAEFDADDFDPINYINKHFPDENSLNGLDSYIQKLQGELSTVNQEIMGSIQEHALLEVDIQNQVSQSKKQIQNLIQDVTSIKEKAQSSEILVTEMCKDIKSLDIAKKNLTFSITALKKYTMMTAAIDKLREACEERKYREVANLIEAIEDFFLYFKKYEDVSQIQALVKEKNGIISELKAQIMEDFTAWGRGNCTFSKDILKEACVLIETLGLHFRNEVVQLICDIVLKPYNDEFTKPANSTIEVIERRYPWINRRLKEIETIYEGIFPENWGMRCFILHEFCGMTRLHITEVLEQHHVDDVDTFLRALDKTMQFEDEVVKDLNKRYAKYLQPGGNKELEGVVKKEFIITSLPKLKGSISDSFEQYMKPYVDREEMRIREKINEAFAAENFENTDVLESSITMMRNFVTTKTKTTQYSRGQTMYDIWRAFQRVMRYYVEEVTGKLARDGKNKGKDEVTFETYACKVVNTGDYCKENLEKLVDSVKSCLDWPHKDKVIFEEEEELFISLSNKGIEGLLTYFGQKSDAAFGKILKIDWSKVDDDPDTSDYVKELAMALEEHVKIVKKTVIDTYFVYYLSKLVDMIQKKFLEYVYKMKKFPDSAMSKLQLDAFEMKTVLANLVKVGSEGRKSSTAGTQTTYSDSVEKKMKKVENILKLLGMNNEIFAENVKKKQFVGDLDAQEIDKLNVLKGLKKPENTNVFKNFVGNILDK